MNISHTNSELNFESLFSKHPHGVGATDGTGMLIAANDALCTMSGYAREELVGRALSEFIPDDSRAAVSRALSEAASGQSSTFDFKANHKSGAVSDGFAITLPMSRNGSGGMYFIFQALDERRNSQRSADQSREVRDRRRGVRSLFHHNPDGVLSLDRQGTILEINDACLRIGGYPREAVIGLSFEHFLEVSQAARTRAFFQRALAGKAVALELQTANTDGTPRFCRSTMFPRYANDQIVGVYAIVQDITQRRNDQVRLRAQSERIRELYLMASGENFAESHALDTLRIGCRLLQMDAAAIIDCTGDRPTLESRFDVESSGGAHDAELITLAQAVLDSREAYGAHYRTAIGERLTIGGERYGVLLFASARDDGTQIEPTDRDLVALMAALLGGALERRQARANLRTLAYYDSLTGLPNRIMFQERLRDALENAQSQYCRVGVLFFDLDRFKDVNDTLGHVHGDHLLQLVASRLVSVAGERATVARSGGDEFIVLLPECDGMESVRVVAERLLHAIDEPYQLDDYEQFITTSVGIAVYPEDGETDLALIKNADIAMYRAKDRGRNAYQFYTPTLEAPIQMRLSQEKLLRRALELEEFRVYYQPEVRLATGAVVGLEALVRWHHPKSGIIYPAQFIPSAEISGLIVQLGDWVLDTAARQTRHWHQYIPDLRLAVNLSARQFHQRDLRFRITQTLERAEFDPANLELEITETVAMSEASQTIEIMRDLKEAGVHFAVDDFGTGYSSLSYLRRFPLDVLKIDQSFVAGIGTQASDETIVKTVIAMAHSLGLEVVAEGVETRLQYDFLRAQGCDRAQGYFLSAAIPADAAETFLEASVQGVSP
ncbi:MAG: EAL domain-containing protein [Candidatus Eremiobacteraeota bacterium]|nr:EAL domain-containing protein [Candidatus Eremiobacteraeota bacterium]